MKRDLFTSVIAAVAGVLIAFFVCNIFLKPIEDVTYKTVNGTVTSTVAEPNPEVFNYKALNPTVEVYVGECDMYDAAGECVETETSGETLVESGEQ